MDQICEGQVEVLQKNLNFCHVQFVMSKKLPLFQWNRLEDEFDIVSIGYEDKNRQYPVLTGFENWKKQVCFFTEKK